MCWLKELRHGESKWLDQDHKSLSGLKPTSVWLQILFFPLLHADSEVKEHILVSSWGGQKHKVSSQL